MTRAPGRVAVLLGVAVCALAGCGGGGAPAPPPAAPPASAAPHGDQELSPLPARPVDLPLDGVEPCALLSADQRGSLGIPDQGQRSPDSDLLGSTSCIWAGSSQPPHGAVTATAVTKQGLDYFRTADDQLIDVDGQPAVAAAGPEMDPAVHCQVLVDVAPHETLWVDYQPDGPPSPGSTHELACERARDAARAMISTLRSQLRK